MDPIREQIERLTRRHFFGRTGLGLGTAALSTLLAENARSDDNAHRRPRPAAPRRTGGLPGCRIFRPRPSGRSICS